MARGEHELPPTNEWLTPGEADSLFGLRFTKRRVEYLLRRWVCKNAVAAASALPVDLASLGRIELLHHPSGAPHVHVDGAPLGVEISTTDRAGWAVCLVGEDLTRVGCDVEIVEPRSEAFVADFFTRDEQAYVASLTATDRDATANLIWSAKESALKVLQTGLRRDTRSVEVIIEPTSTGGAGAQAGSGWARLEVRTAEGTCLPGWWRRNGVFLVTVASERPLDPPTALAGSTDLDTARPVHSWLRRPLSLQTRRQALPVSLLSLRRVPCPVRARRRGTAAARPPE